MSRQSRKSRWSDKVTGGVLGAFGFVLLAVLAGITIYLGPFREPLDPETNCPTAGPVAIHMVLIDRSDPISPQQAQRVRQWAEAQKENAAAGTRFDVYAFEGDTQNVLQPLLSLCAVQQPQTVNALYQNEKMVRQQYETKFVSVLDGTISDLLQATTRPTSPIIESLRAAAQTSFGPAANKAIPLQVTLISDLVQHSPEFSHYKTEADFDLISRNPIWPQLRAELRGADVKILYVLRPKAVRGSTSIQNRGHQEFWAHLIAASGGRVSEITPF